MTSSHLHRQTSESTASQYKQVIELLNKHMTDIMNEMNGFSCIVVKALFSLNAAWNYTPLIMGQPRINALLHLPYLADCWFALEPTFQSLFLLPGLGTRLLPTGSAISPATSPAGTRPLFFCPLDQPSPPPHDQLNVTSLPIHRIYSCNVWAVYNTCIWIKQYWI